MATKKWAYMGAFSSMPFQDMATEDSRSGRFYQRAERLATKAEDWSHPQRGEQGWLDQLSKYSFPLVGQEVLSLPVQLSIHSFIHSTNTSYLLGPNVIELHE